MTGRPDEPGTSLIFPPRATTEGHIVKLETELKSAKKQKSRLGLLSLLLGGIAVTGILGAMFIFTNSNQLVASAQSKANVNVSKLRTDLDTLNGQLAERTKTIDTLREQNKQFGAVRPVVEARFKILQVQERVGALAGLITAPDNSLSSAVREAKKNDLKDWELQLTNLNADNWSGVVSTQMTAEIERLEANEKIIENYLITQMDRNQIKVPCTRVNPFDESKHANCR